MPADLWRLGAQFLLVLTLLAVVLYLLRRLQQRTGLGGTRRLRLVESLSVGPRHKVAVLSWDGQEWLVGVGPQGLSVLGTAPEKTP